MRVTVVLEERFMHTPDGATYTVGPATYALWQRYLEVFEEVQVVGRSRLTFTPPAGSRRVDGVGVVVAHMPYYHGPEAFVVKVWPLWRAMRRAIQFQDAVILRNGTLAALAVMLLRLRGQPYAVEVVSDPKDVFRSGVRHPLRRMFQQLFVDGLRRLCRGASAVLYVTRRELQRAYPAAPGRPTFGVSDVQLPPEAFGEARIYTQPALRAVLVGSLAQWYKGPDIALKALAKLRSEGLKVTLTIVGDGQLRPEIEAMAERLGEADALSMVGQRATPVQVRQDLQAAELFVMPSYAEGLPRALVEAMAQGLPALGSNVGGIPELLPDDCLIAPGSVDSLAGHWRALAQDPARLTRLSARNLEVAREYADELLSAERNTFFRAVRAAQSGRRP